MIIQRFYIWSRERDSFWLISRRGYTKHKMNAGQFRLEEAMQILKEANIISLEELLLPVEAHSVKDPRPEFPESA